MQAIQTKFKGYTFRSRLEARWAVLFDQLNYNWEYEIEGFVLSDGEWYLPDFKISYNGRHEWIEIKPRHSDGDGKIQLLQKDNPDDSFCLVSGDPFDCFENLQWLICPRCGFISKSEFIYDTAIMCFPCDLETPGGDGHPKQKGFISMYSPYKGTMDLDEDDFSDYYNKIRSASIYARSYRF